MYLLRVHQPYQYLVLWNFPLGLANILKRLYFFPFLLSFYLSTEKFLSSFQSMNLSSFIHCFLQYGSTSKISIWKKLFCFLNQVVNWWRICLPIKETQEMWVWSLGQEDPLVKENGNPPQYSRLENPMGRGAWQATYSTWGRKESDTTEHARLHASIS